MTVALTLAVVTMLSVALGKVGNYLINVERARIVSQVSALAAVYGGEPMVREVAQLNNALMCGYREPTAQQQSFAVCVDVEGSQSQAHAVDTWSNSVPTLEP
ncbi:MAG: hypothetical protein WCH38_06715 [Actinomycetota bacterium]